MKLINKYLPMLLTVMLAGILPGCDDDRGIQESAPRVGSFHVGDNEVPPNISEFTSTPDSAELDIDFGLVDVATVANATCF